MITRLFALAMLVFAISSSATSAVINRGVAWPIGYSAKVCFMDGSIAQRQQIVAVASEWSRYASIKLEFGEVEKPRQCDDAKSADIRVTIKGNGSWSYLGREALEVLPPNPTMVLADAIAYYDRADILHFKMLVLHEFGHALGFLHEIQNPNSPCDIDAKAFATATGFSRDLAESQFGKIKPSPILYIGPFDSQSVMMNEQAPFLVGGSSNPCFIQGPNINLSAGDRAALLAVYGPPSGVHPAPIVVASVQFRKSVEQAGILNSKLIEAAVANGFSQKVSTINPLETIKAELDKEIKTNLEELAEKAIKESVNLFPDAITAYRNNNFRTCQRLLIDAANSGNSNANLILAEISYGGLGLVIKDFFAAAKYIGMAAGILPSGAARPNPPNPSAIYLFALMNEAGIGVHRDEEKAILLLNTAGKAGLPEAYLRLGEIYLSDQESLAPDFEQAGKAFKQAASQGNGLAKLSLAALTTEGFIPKDEQIDLKSLLEAAATNIPWARLYVALLYADGTIFPKDQSHAQQMLNEVATEGLPIAQTLLGFSYDAGQLNAADTVKAAWWYKTAVQQKDPIAAFRLASLIMSGKVERNGYPDPAELIMVSAKAGFPQAQYKLALMYLEGREFPLDQVSAAAWLIIAASRLSGVEQEQAMAERDRVASILGSRYADAQVRANSIYVHSAWANPEVKSMPPMFGGVPDTHGYSIKEQGSGFFFAPGYILSNYHVVTNCDLTLARLSDDQYIIIHRIYYDQSHDLAMMKVLEAVQTPSATWHLDDIPLPLPVFAAGFPLPSELDTSSVSLERGDIAQASGLLGDLSKWRITARIHKGNSGGPIFDDEGNVVGVAMGGDNKPDGKDIAFAYKGLLVKALFGDLLPMDTQIKTTKLEDKQIQALATQLVVSITCMINTGQGGS